MVILFYRRYYNSYTQHGGFICLLLFFQLLFDDIFLEKIFLKIKQEMGVRNKYGVMKKCQHLEKGSLSICHLYTRVEICQKSLSSSWACKHFLSRESCFIYEIDVFFKQFEENDTDSSEIFAISRRYSLSQPCHFDTQSSFFEVLSFMDRSFDVWWFSIFEVYSNLRTVKIHSCYHQFQGPIRVYIERVQSVLQRI